MKRGIYWNNKLYGIIFIGFLLFSGSMMVFLDFFQEKDYEDVEYFILVNDGVFSYLDSKGYNLEFTTQINGVLLKESKTSVESKQIVIESENPFGKTLFVFDRLNSKEVKFSINHQGNIQRDYEFSMILVNKGLKMHRSKPILAWQSGYLDFNDMQVEEGFKIDQNWWSKDIILMVDFLNTADFYIDPLLSQDLVLDSVDVTRFDVFQGILENQTDFFWDTTNITNWSQWNSANEQEFGVYSDSLLQNADFEENYDSSLFDSSIDDDFGAWYSKDGSVSSANNSITSAFYETDYDLDSYQNDIIYHLDFNDNASDSGNPIRLYDNSNISRSFDDCAYFRSMNAENTNKSSFNTAANYSFEFTSYGWGQWSYVNNSHLQAFLSFNNTGASDLPFSLSAWVNIDQNVWDLGQSRANEIISKYWSSFNWREYRFYQGANDELRFELANWNSGSDKIEIATVKPLSLDEWHFVVATYDGNLLENGMKIYIDGKEAATVSASAGTYTGQTFRSQQVAFGSRGINGWGCDFNGYDEAIIWNSSLPAPFVKKMYYASPYSNTIIPLSVWDEDSLTFGDKGIFQDASQGYTFSKNSYDDRLLDINFDGSFTQNVLENADFNNGNDGNWTLISGVISSNRVQNNYGGGAIGFRDCAVYQDIWIDTNSITQVSCTSVKYAGIDMQIVVRLYFSDGSFAEEYTTPGTGMTTCYLSLSNIPANKIAIRLWLEIDMQALENQGQSLDNAILSVNNTRSNVLGDTFHECKGFYENDPSFVSSYNSDAGGSLNLTKNGAIEFVNFTDWDKLSFGDGSSDVAFSLEAWVYVTTDSLTDFVILAKSNPSSDFEYSLSLNRTASNIFYPYFILMNVTDNQTFIKSQSDVSFSIGNWNHLFATYNGNSSSSGLSIFLNGSLVSQTRSSSGSYVAMNNTDSDFTIGSSFIGANMKIDDVVVYNAVIPIERIELSYNQAPFAFPAFNNTDGGRFSINGRFLALNSSESVSQDVFLDSDNLTNILFDSLFAGYDDPSEGLIVTLSYSDASNTTQVFSHEAQAYWYGNSSLGMLGKEEFTNISSGKTIISINFLSNNSVSDCFLDNIFFNYSIDFDFHSLDEFVWKPIGLDEYSVSGTAQQRSWFFHHRNDSAYRSSGIFTNNSFMSLDHDNTWIIELNLTFNPYSAFWNDLSFAGGIQLHFLDSSNDSLSFVDLIDNSTSSGLHQVGGSLFYNTSTSSGVFAKDHEYDSSNYNLTNELLRIKKVDDLLFVNYPESLDFGGNWTSIGNTSVIFQQGNPVNLGILFFRNTSTRSMDYPNINSTNKDYFTAGNDYSENFTGISVPEYSRYVFDSPMSISSLNFSYYEAITTDETNIIIGDLYGFLVSGSNQVFYEFNYTIAYPNDAEVWNYHNHSFLMPHNYTFVNTTFGDGTVKTIISGFSISSFNGTHDEYSYEDIVNGTFTWFFLTSNAIVNFIINPQWSINGTLTNQNLIEYNIRVANGSTGLLNYPVNISLKNTNEEILYSVQEVTGLDGWLNSSFNQQVEMLADHEFWVCATGINQSFLGYAVDYYLAYNDWVDPVISDLVYNASLTAGTTWHLSADISDNWTNQSDLTVQMKWSFISSSSYDRTSNLNLESGLFTLSIIGQDADESLWFKIQATDNLSNQVETATFQVDWVTEEEEPTPGPGNGVAPAARPAVADGGIDPIFLIIVFAAGAIMVAVIGYAVMKRVVVRTRKVETREVITTIGRFGRSKEKIEEKGG